MKDYTYWMRKAIELAKKAESIGEVPVGAVLVDEQNQLLAEGYNEPISTRDPTAHAEIVCLRQGALKVKNYRLLNTTLYVTLEPCAMCAAAIIHARVGSVVFGAYDMRAGACGSAIQLIQHPSQNHSIEVISGIEEGSCKAILDNFFAAKR